MVANRIVGWNDHLLRGHVPSWATKLIRFMDRDWFVRRRMSVRSWSAFGGKTETRSGAGAPGRRFHDGVVEAKIYIDS